MKAPETPVLNRMLERVRAEITYMNSCITPPLVKKYGAGTFKTGLVIRCAEQPSLIDAPRSQTGAVSLEFKDCIRYSGRSVAIDKAKFLRRYYSTDEGKRYREFLDSITDPHERERYEIF